MHLEIIDGQVQQGEQHAESRADAAEALQLRFVLLDATFELLHLALVACAY